MEDIKVPKTIKFRRCPKCGSKQSWSVTGWAYPAGDDSHFTCYRCDYQGRPEYKTFKICELKEI